MWDSIKEFAREMKVYALGKGILTLAVMGAAAGAAMFGISIWIPAVLASVGGLALTATNRFYQQSLREETMVDIYRNSIAAQLHIAPAAVSPSHLKEAAKHNHVIDAALKLERKKTILTISTAALAAGVTLLTLGAFNGGELLHTLADQALSGSVLKPLASLVGIGTVASATSLILHQGLDVAIGYSSGIRRASANDMILAMDSRLRRGGTVSQQQVFGVLVASNPALKSNIQQTFGKAYAGMSRKEQQQVIEALALTDIVAELQQKLQSGQMTTGSLADLADRYHDLSNPTPAPTADTPAPTRAGFVERLGLAPRATHASHVTQLAASHEGGGNRVGFVR